MLFNLFSKKNPKEEQPISAKLPKIEIKYTYEWDDSVPIDERDIPDHPSRPFCKKMMELSATRLWSRTDIEKISEKLGYSVWDRKGGDGCRHKWVRHVVTRKES